jgi:SNF2 family DNA or RNA helicase
MTTTQPYRQSARPYTPRKYQKVAIKFLLEHACAGLLLKPGLGKTSSTLAAISLLKKRKVLGKVLIIAPLRPCYLVWPREIQKWADFNHLTYAIAHGPDKEAALKADVDIVLMNPEGIDWLLGVSKTVMGNKKKSIAVDMKRWKSHGFDAMVLDELSKWKHHNTDRFKALKQVHHTLGRRWGLTGSPSANGLMDLFGQCYILDQGNALGRYITKFRDEFFYPHRNGFDWDLQPGAEERIYERIEPLMLSMGYEHLDMPEKIENNIFVQLPPDVREVYNQMEKFFLSAVDDRVVSAANAAAKSTKLRQVANGGIFLDPELQANGLFKVKAKRDTVDLHHEKILALRDLVDELQGDPLLVAYDFEHDLSRLKAAFKDGVFAGDYNMKQLDDIERRWNRGEIPLLFGHPQSIGHGLNLQEAAQHVCWHSLTWNRELYDQFIDRVWRQGSKFKQVFIHHIIAEDTIDEVLYGVLNSKGSAEQALFDGIVRMARERRGK